MVRRMVLACAHDRPREPCRDEKEPTRIARRGGRHAEPALAAQRAARRPRTPPQVPARRGLPRVPRGPRVGGACDAAAVCPHQHRVRDRHHVQLGPADPASRAGVVSGLCIAARGGRLGGRSGRADLRLPDLAGRAGRAEGPLGAGHPGGGSLRRSRPPQVQPGPARLDTRRAVRRRAPCDSGGSCALARLAARCPGDPRPRAVQEIRFLTAETRAECSSPMTEPRSGRNESSAGMLALGSWLVLTTALLPGLVADPTGHSPYHWLIFATSVLGLAGGAKRGWRRVIVMAAALYLLIVVVRFLTVSVWWQLEFASFLDAVRFALWLKSRVPIYYFSQGRLLDGTAITFYEALMPAFQVIVLLGVAISARRPGITG